MNDTSQFATTGYCNGRHTVRDISRHEHSSTHTKSTEILIKRKVTGGCIDKGLVEQYESEKKYWHSQCSKDAGINVSIFQWE